MIPQPIRYAFRRKFIRALRARRSVSRLMRRGTPFSMRKGYLPIKIRSAIIPVTNIGSKLAMPLFIIGLMLSYYGEKFLYVAYAGIICFSLCALFQLVTLPAEINASRRAVTAIEGSLLTPEETDGAKKVLTAAALTYVAALAVSLVQLLRLIAIAGSRRRD